jgi:putative spermidine/putrescine transport system ATP-binding protein
MSFLTLTSLSKFYGTQCAVDDMNLSVEKGEFLTLLGPSGCGKTTTLQMIAGFVEASQGQIFLDGKNITHSPPNTRGLGIVFQSYALFPHMTVSQNVSFGLEMRRIAKQERADRVASALALVHLSELAQRYPRELSGGQRQRVALARALVIEPPVLLLDEPLSNLDAKLREDMQFELRQIQRKVGTTTIMVTHDQTEAMSLSDRVVVMQAGRVTQIDKPFTLYENPQTQFISTFVGKANLLQGQLKDHDGDCCIDMQGLKLKVTPGIWAHGQALMVSVRPEKIQCVAQGTGRVDGLVMARFFLGSQWLYQVETAQGLLTVTCANNERLPLNEGQSTGLDWSDEAMRVLP